MLVKGETEINKFCHSCQLNSRAPGRFKFTLRDDYDFNYEVFVNVIYLDSNKPVLHVEALRICWIDVYLGPPDWIITDAGLNFHAAKFKRAAHALSIKVKEIPIEAHNSISKVERYHGALRRAYEIIRNESDAEPEVAL
ncbi:hypothetical protein LX36DRAFT_683289 [Colletotrichum falcatum]|nr:hypothetical protein LX36DRAFT_683289 [Colletotrichum falcatum]